MKNNRQVGLDGKVFLTSCLKRSSVYVIGVILFGIINAIADVMKLTGKSGIAMSSLTTTLISVDLIVSLLFVVVVFYAYFLECGSSIPVLREKPIIVLGYCRLAYNVLLCYYIVYRAMYCLVNSSVVPFGILMFYIVYMVVTFLSILACCVVINIISRNMIRRIYAKTLRNLAVVGIVFTSLTPVMYIIARFWIGEIGDEFFTGSFCDLLRLCIAPLFYLCLWIVMLKARTVTAEVFGEVDAAIRDRRYQITYTDNTKENDEKPESRKLKNSKAKAAAAAATAAAIEAEVAPQTVQQAALPEVKKPEAAETEPKSTKEEKNEAKENAEAVYPQRVVTENTIKTRESRIKDEKLRKAVSDAVEKAIKEDEKKAEDDKQTAKNTNSRQMPVMEFDPYATADKAQNRTSQANRPKQAQKVQPRPNNQVRQNNNFHQGQKQNNHKNAQHGQNQRKK